MKCEHCEARNPEFSYLGHAFCCECMSELCSWFLDGGQQENPEQFAYISGAGEISAYVVSGPALGGTE